MASTQLGESEAIDLDAEAMEDNFIADYLLHAQAAYNAAHRDDVPREARHDARRDLDLAEVLMQSLLGRRLQEQVYGRYRRLWS